MYAQTESRRRLLSSLNPAMIVLGVLGVGVIRTSLIRVMPDFIIYWDVLYPVALYLGQRRGLVEGFVITLFLAHVYSLSSGAPLGLFAILYILVFSVSRIISFFVYADSILMISCALMLLYSLSRLCLPMIAQSFNCPIHLMTWTNLHPARFILNYITGFFTYWVLLQVDRLTFKVQRSEIDMGGRQL